MGPEELGRRIKNARFAIGITQTELAAGEVSVGQVSRIESGRRRPDAALLEAFAVRLGTTVDALIAGVSADQADDLRLQLHLAEIALASGRHDETLSLTDAAIERLGDVGYPELTDRARRLRARALESLDRLDDAVAALESLTSDSPRDLRWARAMVALSRCRLGIGAADTAEAAATSALAELDAAGLGASDEAVELTVALAAAYVAQGDRERAISLCEAKIVELDRSPARPATAYLDASRTEQERGNLPAAIALAERAVTVVNHGHNPRSLARLSSRLGAYLLDLDEPDSAAARGHLRRAAKELALSTSSAFETDRARMWFEIGTLMERVGDAGGSRDAFKRSAESAVR